MSSLPLRLVPALAAPRGETDSRPAPGIGVGVVLSVAEPVGPHDWAKGQVTANAAGRMDLSDAPADARLIDAYDPALALRDRVLPWRRMGGGVVVAVSDPAAFAAAKPRLEHLFGRVMMGLADERAVEAAVLRQRRHALAARAEARVAPGESCRDLRPGRHPGWLVPALAAVVGLILWHPVAAFSALAFWACLTLVLSQGLRVAAALAELLGRRKDRRGFQSVRGAPEPARLPRVSLLVPLFREREIAGRLLRRLDRLAYPRDLLDILLIAEENDTITQATVEAAGLPPWMRLVTVPPGTLQTKPRALNYALDFARGSIIGVYDAEDAPAPDQIRQVVTRFARSGPEVACLQGILDFYNPHQNWLSRCFTVDYAAWFRIILPGLLRLGLVIPLGGTTLFFRRAALEALGGWDAHNVTEDADLGIRLARRGYRTELIATVTEEEANCHVWPWVRQRSRWLKGYAMTWAVHSRSPRRLLSDLGPWRFFGVQVLLLGTLSQFVLAPVLWSFWLLPLGVPHPLADVLPRGLFLTLGALFLLAEVANVAIGCAAVAGPRHRWLIPWVPTLHLYWPLGAIASYKAMFELISRPFYWDKTAHGISSRPDAASRAPAEGPSAARTQDT
ncbi:glycosyltransferase family 2 protein [Palleronia sp. KMU-117]|uniref:glycosyltransferase family 2 protein n=1 Tax=Palleronia sp. KMU-117 TaxID=3434108 RepID=UPI003D722883